MNVEFKDTGQWFASDNAQGVQKGPYKSRDDAIRQYASRLPKEGALVPFYVHSKVEARIDFGAENLLEYIVNSAKEKGVYGLENFEKVKTNPKAMNALTEEVQASLKKALAAVQTTDVVVLTESNIVYPREFAKYVG